MDNKNNQKQSASAEATADRHKTWWDEENEVIRLQVFGDYDEQDAGNTVSKITESKNQSPGIKFKFLIDLSQANKPSSKARKIIVEKIYKDQDLEKIACVADSVLVRTVNSFLIKAAGIGSDKVKVVKNEQEALKWLKS